MNAGPGGFAGAPVSKVLVAGVAGSSIVVQAVHYWRGRLPYIDAVGHLLVFKHPGVLIFGTALLYYFRVFERQWGSVKYGSFCTIVLGVSYALEQAAVKLLSWPAIPGPYPLLFANYVAFFFDVPPTQRFTIFGVPLTDKVCVPPDSSLFVASLRCTYVISVLWA